MTDAFDGPPVRRTAWLRWVATVAGLVLLAGALVIVFDHGEVVTAARELIRSPRPWALTLLLLGVVANLGLTAWLFRILIGRYGNVGFLEMQALIASATLLNFLPLRPGLIGRVAWHKRINDIRATDSARTVLQSIMISAVVVISVVGALLIGHLTGVSIAIPLAATAITVAVVGIVRPALRRLASATLVRGIEVGVWAVRYAAAFSLVGTAIDVETALALACVGQMAMLVGVFGNGLGVREWAIGLAAAQLTPGILAIGIAADLVNRAAELIVITTLGSIATTYLARSRRFRDRSS